MPARHDAGQTLTSQPSLYDERPHGCADLLEATSRFDRHRVLLRKLAHQKSGTGQAMTNEERGELRQLTAYYVSE